jgi:hypothetical protein
MKSKHRHDLETNELARHLAGWIEKLKPHANIMILVVGIIAGLMLVNSLWSNAAASKERAAWDAFALATRTSDRELMQLQRVAEEYPDTTMQDWAYAAWADRQLQLAAGAYLFDRQASLDRMRRVMGIYEGLIAADKDLLILDRAHMGLARIYEMQGKLEEARSHYRQVQGDMTLLASQRADQLESPEVQKACQWLATAPLPKPSVPQGLGTPGVRPDFGAALPEASEGISPENLKSIETLLGEAMNESSGGAQEDRYGESAEASDDSGAKPPEEKPDAPALTGPQLVLEGSTAQEPAAEKPAAEEPAAEKPAAEKPAAEEPAAEEPAAEKPAAEEPAAEEPAAEKPAAEEPAAEEPAAEEPAAEEPATEEPAAEEPAVEEPAVEEPAVEEPATEEPAAEEPAEEEPAAP